MSVPRALARALTALVTTLPAALPAQNHALVGTWAIEYPGSMRNDGGTITAITMKGQLAVEQLGDSLIATLVTEAPAGSPPRPPLRLATKRADGDAAFVHHAEATVTVNGEASVRTSVSTWTFRTAGDDLSGSLDRKLEGMTQGTGPQALSGKRVKTG